ncbi:PhzF family phenazine biosynthesis protein [Kribbella amoyensis]|uniref:PhzF family phenazine biosynthesis protein n=1 Tax=Kribbella amoyensis TaxID=996641 RepID=A0A561BN60_9ACTN|nr:PhzF family phenazine biosynthesis protein [Kribbella amoyensis]TWD80277.1 PhzF family phenazine biosynthesis protein [Kribbella amoyensis]
MRIRIIDAFTDRPFAGNQAGVCLLPLGPWPDTDWMQRVAAELNLAETAFARPVGPAEADWELRWFTPAVEVRMCGHATLATTQALVDDKLIEREVRFGTLSGVLAASVGEDGEVTLDFPVSPPVPLTTPAGLAEALGVEPVGVYGTGALGDLLVELADEAQVRALTPDLGLLERLNRTDAVRGTIITAAAAKPAAASAPTAATPEPTAEYDFVSRFFAPASGIPEDPVTGSAHTALAPFWAARLGGDHLTGYQASPRGGVVRVVLAGDRVHLIGRAVTVLDGELLG